MDTTNRFTWPHADSYAFMEQVRVGMPPVIVCCACNGGIQGKEVSDALPETPDEIADSVYEAYQAGAAMVHVHARDPQNLARPARTFEAWYEVNTKIRERCPDIIINDTTGAGPGITDEERLQCLDAGPEVASLNLTPDMSRFRIKERPSPLSHPHPAVEYDECWAISYKQVTWFASEMHKRDVKPELELYHPGGHWVVRHLMDEGLLSPPYWIQTVMGYQTGSYPTVDNVVQMLRELPQNTLWLCSGVGAFQLPLTTLAILLGGHVRVGLEDNVYYRRGEKATSNAQLVARAARIAHELNRDVATPAQARQMLGLSLVPTKYRDRPATREARSTQQV